MNLTELYKPPLGYIIQYDSDGRTSIFIDGKHVATVDEDGAFWIVDERSAL